ncbi:MAG: hypothetical protein NTW86_04300 [Candidatus Sumerlaeota bacterium]|nr:hypothetical protein [Candidatus Sumerlaeota bacterium]
MSIFPIVLTATMAEAGSPTTTTAAKPTAAGGGKASAPRYLLTILNQNYFRDEADRGMAAEALRQFTAICRARGVEPELFFTGLSFDMHLQDVPEIMMDLKESGRDWNHHGSNRPPNPNPIERAQGKPWNEAIQAVQDYEQDELIDGRPAQLDPSRVGGLKKMCAYFGRPPLSTGRFVKVPILEVCKQYGAKMGVGGQDWYKLPSSWFWFMGTLNRPDDVFVHPTWDFNEWARYCWELQMGRTPNLKAIQSHPGEPIDLMEKIERRIAQLDPKLPAFVVYCFHNNDFFGYRYDNPNRYPLEYRQFYMKKCEEFLDWLLEDQGCKPFSLREAYEMAAPRNLKPTPEEADDLARGIVEAVEKGRPEAEGPARRPGLPPDVASARSGYALAEAWQLFAAILGEKTPRFPEMLGPIELRPPTEGIGAFAIRDIRKAAQTVRVEGAASSAVQVGPSQINAAEFLYLMAKAILAKPAGAADNTVRGVSVNMIQPFVSGGDMGGPIDRLQFWTYKPAFYGDIGGRVQRATSTEVNVRGRELRQTGEIDRIPASQRAPW